MKTKNNITYSDITEFIKELSILLNSGITLLDSLEILQESIKKQRVKFLIFDIKTRVSNGYMLNEVFRQKSHYFDEIFCNLVCAGEKCGNLNAVFEYIVSYRKKIQTLKNKIKKATFYPILVLFVSVLVVSIILIFVIPPFERLFKSMGADLPIFTKCVINLSLTIKHYFLGIIGFFLVIYVSFKQGLKSYLPAQKFCHKFFLKIPIVGDFFEKIVLCRCFYTFAITLHSGISLLESLGICEKIAGNYIYENAFYKIKQMLIQGKSLNASFLEVNLFPKKVIQMIAIGEETGCLDTMLNHLSDSFEERLNTIIENISLLLEPVIMVFLCIVVGCLVIAMYLPIFRLGTVI